MRILSRARGGQAGSLRLFYFHLEALQTSVIHPKYVDDQLLNRLALTDHDLNYAGAVSEFVDQCSGESGSPTTARRRARIVAAIADLRRSAPSSGLDHRFGLHELDRLEAIVTSMNDQPTTHGRIG